jgi:hypothetical protein
MKASDILDLIKKNGIKIVDFRFVDVPGPGSTPRGRPHRSMRTR